MLNIQGSWKKKVLGIAALAAIAIPISGCGGEKPEKTAVVDYQIVLANHPDRAAAEKELNKEYQNLQDKAASLQNNQNLTSEDKAKQMQAFQKELMTKEKNLLSPIKDNVDQKIDEVMKEQGYTAVYAKQVLIRGGHDITADVLKKEGLSPEDIEKAQQAQGSIAADSADGGSVPADPDNGDAGNK